MSKVIATYDLDEDHGRLWVNADLKRMPEVVIVANQPMDRAQTVTYVPETRLLEAMDEAREAGRRADMAERVAADRKVLCDSLRKTNDDLRRIIDEMKDTERLDAENAKLRELVSDFDKCLTEAARLAYIQGHMTIYDGTLLDSLHPRMRELGMETSE